jgi:hypothetical protein
MITKEMIARATIEDEDIDDDGNDIKVISIDGRYFQLIEAQLADQDALRFKGGLEGVEMETKAWLRDQGFDLQCPIERERDIFGGFTYFFQARPMEARNGPPFDTVEELREWLKSRQT